MIYTEPQAQATRGWQRVLGAASGAAVAGVAVCAAVHYLLDQVGKLGCMSSGGCMGRRRRNELALLIANLGFLLVPALWRWAGTGCTSGSPAKCWAAYIFPDRRDQPQGYAHLGARRVAVVCGAAGVEFAQRDIAPGMGLFVRRAELSDRTSSVSDYAAHPSETARAI